MLVGLDRCFFFSLRWQEPNHTETFTPWWRMELRAISEQVVADGNEEATRIRLFLVMADRLGLRAGDILIDDRDGKAYRILTTAHYRGDDQLVVTTDAEVESGMGYLLQLPPEY